jgi:hypothetical protein
MGRFFLAFWLEINFLRAVRYVPVPCEMTRVR